MLTKQTWSQITASSLHHIWLHLPCLCTQKLQQNHDNSHTASSNQGRYITFTMLQNKCCCCFTSIILVSRFINNMWLESVEDMVMNTGQNSANLYNYLIRVGCAHEENIILCIMVVNEIEQLTVIICLTIIFCCGELPARLLNRTAGFSLLRV